MSFPNVANPLEGSVEVIATGYIWTEGPVWVGGEAGQLLFSDVPGNAIYSWDGKRTTAFLAPSGYQGFPIPASLREAGSSLDGLMRTLWKRFGQAFVEYLPAGTSTRTTGLGSDLGRQTDRSSSHLRFAYVSSSADDDPHADVSTRAPTVTTDARDFGTRTNTATSWCLTV